MAKVIGKNRMNLKKIEAKTKATLKVFERNSLYIKGSPGSQKLAIRAIKETVVSLSVIRKVLCGNIFRWISPRDRIPIPSDSQNIVKSQAMKRMSK